MLCYFAKQQELNYKGSARSFRSFFVLMIISICMQLYAMSSEWKIYGKLNTYPCTIAHSINQTSYHAYWWFSFISSSVPAFYRFARLPISDMWINVNDVKRCADPYYVSTGHNYIYKLFITMMKKDQDVWHSLKVREMVWIEWKWKPKMSFTSWW